jgi:hypothetical protein
MNITAGKNGQQSVVLPFESPIARKLVFSKLVDMTAVKQSLKRIFSHELAERIDVCRKSKSSYY